jgi:hypothetical protein
MTHAARTTPALHESAKTLPCQPALSHPSPEPTSTSHPHRERPIRYPADVRRFPSRRDPGNKLSANSDSGDCGCPPRPPARPTINCATPDHQLQRRETPQGPAIPASLGTSPRAGMYPPCQSIHIDDSRSTSSGTRRGEMMSEQWGQRGKRIDASALAGGTLLAYHHRTHCAHTPLMLAQWTYPIYTHRDQQWGARILPHTRARPPHIPGRHLGSDVRLPEY